MDKQKDAMQHKKPGPRPLTEVEKRDRARLQAEKKAKAAAMKPNVVVQYQEQNVSVEALYEAARADFKMKKKRTLITSLDLYVKPEEQTAYYVVNGEHEGSVAF